MIPSPEQGRSAITISAFPTRLSSLSNALYTWTSILDIPSLSILSSINDTL